MQSKAFVFCCTFSVVTLGGMEYLTSHAHWLIRTLPMLALLLVMEGFSLATLRKRADTWPLGVMSILGIAVAFAAGEISMGGQHSNPRTLADVVSYSR